jgi:hypothetical protein
MFKRKILRQRSSRDEFQKNVKPMRRIDFDFDLPRIISIAVCIRGKLQVVAFELRYRVAYLPDDQDYPPFPSGNQTRFHEQPLLGVKESLQTSFQSMP